MLNPTSSGLIGSDWRRENILSMEEDFYVGRTATDIREEYILDLQIFMFERGVRLSNANGGIC
ncbi:hypothetical protein bcgnr5407_58600 [Bacillus cereus]